MKTCGLDVHKNNVFCAIPRTSYTVQVFNGKEYSQVLEYETTIPKIRQMGEYLRSEGVTKVATCTERSVVWKAPQLTGCLYGMFCLKWALNLCLLIRI